MKLLIPTLWILAALLLLAACQTAAPEPAPPEIDTLVVQITPSARPVIPAVQACGALLPDVDLRLVERYANQSEPGLLIRLRESEGNDAHMAQITSEEIGIILHPDNPAASLTVDQIRDLFTGTTSSWSDLGGVNSAVKVWIPYPGDEARQAFEEQILSGVPVASDASLAPDPESLRTAVASDPAAIGLLPSIWAGDGVKFILVGVRLPVLISSDTPLEGHAAELTACLQGETGQTILDAIYP